MSCIPNSIIQLYAESLGLTNLSEEVLSAMAHDVEFRTREIIQEAGKFMMHSRRAKLTVNDVNMALEAKNVDRLWGYDPSESLNFRLVPNSNIFYIPREEVDLEAFIQQPLPKAPAPITLTSHWLAIDGVQPAIPENPSTLDQEALSAALGVTASTLSGAPSTAKPASALMAEDTEVKPLVKHILSKELQAYFDAAITDLQSNDSERIRAALLSISSDSGLQQLVPYFVQWVAETVPKSLRNLSMLQIAIGLLSSLLLNEHIFVEHYLHQMMPPLLSCLLGKRLCEDPNREDHWTFRDKCASILGDICKKYGMVYATLIPRISRTLLKTLLDGEKPLSSHYGAIVGIAALGPQAIDSLLLPNLESYMKALTPSNSEQMVTDQVSADVDRVKSAIKNACTRWSQSIEIITEEDKKKHSLVQSIIISQ